MKQFRMLCCAIGLLASAGAMAQAAGTVKTATGQATIDSGGTSQPARPGMPLGIGDTVRTGPDGSVGITLKDNTLLSLGPSTAFRLEEFLFAPAQGQLQLSGSIASGSLQYISGAIARLRPQAVQVKTPSGIIGVRGTRFVVVVNE